MLETKTQFMASEKNECLETRLYLFKEELDKISKSLNLVTTSMKGYHQGVHNIDELLKGESSHHMHFHGNHQHSHPRPPKLDMYKFDGSSLTVWVAQMEQYFTLNNI